MHESRLSISKCAVCLSPCSCTGSSSAVCFTRSEFARLLTCSTSACSVRFCFVLRLLPELLCWVIGLAVSLVLHSAYHCCASSTLSASQLLSLRCASRVSTLLGPRLSPASRLSALSLSRFGSWPIASAD